MSGWKCILVKFQSEVYTPIRKVNNCHMTIVTTLFSYLISIAQSVRMKYIKSRLMTWNSDWYH